MIDDPSFSNAQRTKKYKWCSFGWSNHPKLHHVCQQASCRSAHLICIVVRHLWIWHYVFWLFSHRQPGGGGREGAGAAPEPRGLQAPPAAPVPQGLLGRGSWWAPWRRGHPPSGVAVVEGGAELVQRPRWLQTDESHAPLLLLMLHDTSVRILL